MRIYFFICISLLLLLSNSLVAQAPSQMLDYLKKNIKIYYIAQPNNTVTDIREIDPTALTIAGKGIIFGETNNNSMDHSAELLVALFYGKNMDPKTSILKEKKGDTEFQEVVYNVLQLMGKPIVVYFINDKTKGINDTLLSRYSLYVVKEYGGKKNFIWPSTFSMNDKAYAGAMVMGENYYGAEDYRSDFINMLTKMELGNLGPAKLTLLRGVTLPGGEKRPVAFISPDTRQIASQGIANGITLFYSPAFRTYITNWVRQQGYFLLPKDTGTSAPVSVEEQLDIPPEFNLQKMFVWKNNKLVGMPKDSLSHFPVDVIARWYVYSDAYLNVLDKANMEYYRNINDLHLAVKTYGYIQMMGLKKYIECLKNKMDKWSKATWDDKIALIDCTR